MRILIVSVACSIVAAACTPAQQPDAYGNVEAVSVNVSAETAGRLQTLSVAEGQALREGELVATIDATGLALDRDQFSAQQEATAARTTEIDRQIDALDAQRAGLDAQRAAAVAERDAIVATRDVAQRTYDRVAILFGQQAATVQQRDQAERDMRTTSDQVRAQEERIKAVDQQIVALAAQIASTRAQRVTVQRQVAAIGAQVARAAERVTRAEVRNPVGGTVLTVYARAGEVVQPGQPLYSIANLSRVDVRAYVSQAQLAAIRLGQQARVTFDRGTARESVDATVSWIASQAEFTPTPIQTREERTDLVYAIKLSVPNEAGAFKIGMPVDVSFATATP
ncbi:MAG: HlyD family efflux transporter periplasmic adaptor subunit [Vicinamibacterales bacterium]